jgi:hypothetical protein
MTPLSLAVRRVLAAMYEINMNFDGENSALAAAAFRAVSQDMHFGGKAQIDAIAAELGGKFTNH